LIIAVSLLLASCASWEPDTRSEGSYYAANFTEDTAESYSVASFNIKFVGHYRRKDHEALADLMSGYDLVFVQELVAPPYPGFFPDGAPFDPDREAAAFFNAMAAHGFSYVLSEEDTGRSLTNQDNTSTTEWFVAFYNRSRVRIANNLPQGFLESDRTRNQYFDRVPYAFTFELGSEDIVFVSVHLHAGTGATARANRAREFEAIDRWITSQTGSERDFVILGDMNIESCAELAAVLFTGFQSLNHECLDTAVSPGSDRPYDHVFYSEEHTSHDLGDWFRVTDLVTEFEDDWDTANGDYPGDPYDGNLFSQYYSDHHLIEFTVVSDGVDED